MLSFAQCVPDATKTETYSDGTVVSYTYTGDGQLFSVRETKGQVTTLYLYTYDTLGRLIGSEEKLGGTSILRTHQTYGTGGRFSCPLRKTPLIKTKPKRNI